MMYINSIKMNFFKNMITFFILLSTLFLLYSNVFKNDKIAYVDGTKIINDYAGSAAAKATFQKKAKQWQSNIDTLAGNIKTLLESYEKTIATMPVNEQKLTKQLIQTKQSQLENYQKAIRQSAEEENGKLMQSVVSDINAYITRFGKEHNYKLILIANQYGSIAYGRQGTDITADLLKGLNEDYKKRGK